MFFNTKDSMSVEETSNVICRISCSAYPKKYIGKTCRNHISRLDKHGTKVDQTMNQHLSSYSAFNDNINFSYLHSLMQLLIPPLLAKNYTFIISLLATLKF